MTENHKKDMRKISYQFGDLKWIEVPTNWKKAPGIIADRTDTNMALAERDYSIPCDTGTEPLMEVEGYYLWWCKTHHQPLCFCDKAKLKIKLEKIKEGLNAIGFREEEK